MIVQGWVSPSSLNPGNQIHPGQPESETSFEPTPKALDIKLAFTIQIPKGWTLFVGIVLSLYSYRLLLNDPRRNIAINIQGQYQLRIPIAHKSENYYSFVTIPNGVLNFQNMLHFWEERTLFWQGFSQWVKRNLWNYNYLKISQNIAQFHCQQIH